MYAQGLISALADQGEELDVITPHPAIAGKRHLARVVWLQTALPRRLARSRPSALLNLVPEGPLRCPVPQVTIVHDLIPLSYPARLPITAWYFRFIVPILLRASRAVITVSGSTRREVLARYGLSPERVHVAYPGYDRSRFVPGPAPRGDAPPYLLHVGNIAPHKNLVRLVEAFALVAPRTPATLALRGSGPPRHEAALRDRIRDLGIGDRIDWRSYESGADLPRLYRGARALVLPSLHEGFGFPALEAMACGTPVIAARAASIPEVVGDAARLVDPLDVAALAAAMADVLSDDALAADLRARGLARADAFSWERTARAVASHLRA